MASSMTFFTYWKAASPPRAVAPSPKGLGSSGSPGMSDAFSSPRSYTSMTPYSYSASLTARMPRIFISMPETFLAALAAYSMADTSPTTRGRQRS